MSYSAVLQQYQKTPIKELATIIIDDIDSFKREEKLYKLPINHLQNLISKCRNFTDDEAVQFIRCAQEHNPSIDPVKFLDKFNMTKQDKESARKTLTNACTNQQQDNEALIERIKALEERLNSYESTVGSNELLNKCLEKVEALTERVVKLENVVTKLVEDSHKEEGQEEKDAGNKEGGQQGGVKNKKKQLKLHFGDPIKPKKFVDSITEAAKKNDIYSINYILHTSPEEINTKDTKGNTCLHIVCGKNNPELFNLVLSKGADVNAKNNDNVTPIFSAIKSGNLSFCKELFSRGADLEAKDVNLSTPLIHAAEEQKTEIVKWLVSVGADVTARNKDNHTALLWASLLGCEDIIAILQEKGAPM